MRKRLFLALTLLLFAPLCQAQQLFVDPGLQLRLSSEALATVDNGIPLVLRIELKEDSMLSRLPGVGMLERQNFTLKRHALSRRYMVMNEVQRTPLIFDNAQSAVAYIVRQANGLLRGREDSRLRVYLNKFDLPHTLRLKAYLSDDWDISSQWVSWTSAK